MSQEVFGVAVEVWGAVGDIATAGGVALAAVGSWFAYGQLKLSRDARLDQSRPYVVVTFERGTALNTVVDIVVRNVGAGPAYNVSIRPDPPLARAPRGTVPEPPSLADLRYFNEAIPLMPPGYRMETFFDHIPDREEVQPRLPDRYVFTVSYDDGRGNAWTEDSVCDLGLMHDLLVPQLYTEHDIGEALRDIRSYLKNSPLVRGKIEATVESVQEREQRLSAIQEAQRESAQKSWEEQQRRNTQA